jgi:hypothetical protein
MEKEILISMLPNLRQYIEELKEKVNKGGDHSNVQYEKRNKKIIKPVSK